MANQITDVNSIGDIELKEVTEKFPFAITPYLSSIIDWKNEDDPIRKQIFPDVLELEKKSLEALDDPLNEENLMPVKRLIHRYPDRLVLLVTNRCSAYCRHCNRKRDWKNNGKDISIQELKKATLYLKSNPKIREIIISGGDPLMLSTEKLKKVLDAVWSVKTIEVVRIGTRAPVFLPMRITEKLCDLLESYPSIWINTQFNHPAEITKESKHACEKLQKSGFPISNQAVLLKGINDSPKIILELCHKLQEIKVRPYYLFQCDLVAGTEHFWTPLFVGKEIINRMIGATGGLCVPRFVIDLPGGKGKIPILPDYIVKENESEITFKNYANEKIKYKKVFDNVF